MATEVSLLQMLCKAGNSAALRDQVLAGHPLHVGDIEYVLSPEGREQLERYQEDEAARKTKTVADRAADILEYGAGLTTERPAVPPAPRPAPMSQAKLSDRVCAILETGDDDDGEDGGDGDTMAQAVDILERQHAAAYRGGV